MIVSNTAERLREIMDLRRLRQIDVINLCRPLCEKYDMRIGSNDMSQWINGKVQPNQQKLFVLAKVLNVNEAWLMGYDVEMFRSDFSDDRVGSAITDLRVARKLSLMETAAELGISADDLRMYETGAKRVPVDVLRRLAAFFGVNVDTIIGIDFLVPEGLTKADSSVRIVDAQRRWNEEVGVTTFSDDEMSELINYAKYLISKRKDKK